MPRRKKRSWFRKLLRFFRRLLVLICLLALAGFIAIHSDVVQDWAAGELSSRLSTQGRIVNLSGLRGHWPFHFRLEELTVDDGDGIWLRAASLSVDWTYKKGKLTLQDLDLGELEVVELPEIQENPVDVLIEKDPFQRFNLEISCPDFQIGKVIIGPKLAGNRTEGEIAGSFHLPANSSILSFQAQAALAEIQGEVQADMNLATATFSINLNGVADELHTLTLHYLIQDGADELKLQFNTPDTRGLVLLARERLSAYPWAPHLELPGGVEVDEVPFPLSFRGNLLIDQARFELKTDLKFKGGSLQLPLSYDGNQRELSLAYQLEIDDLFPLSSLFEQPLSGKLSSGGRFRYRESITELESALTAQSLVYKNLEIGNLEAGLVQKPHGWQLELDMQRLETEKKQQAKLRAVFAGAADTWTLTTEELSFTAPGLHLQNRQPLQLTHQAGTFHLKDTPFYLNSTPLNVEGSWDALQLDVQIQSAGLDSEDLPVQEGLELKGKAEGQLRIHGPWARPDLNGELRFVNLVLLYEDTEADIVLNGQLSGNWTGEGLQLDGNVLDNRQNQLRLEARSPASWRLRPLQLPDHTAPFSVQAAGSLDLALLNRFDLLEDQRISGKLDCNLSLSRGEKPITLTGSLDLRKGGYENYRLGTRIQQIEVGLQLHNRELEITRAQAYTQGGGSLRAVGKWDFSEFPGAGKITTTLKNARLVHLDPVQAALSGEFHFSKEFKKPPLIDGDLVLEETTFHMDRLPRPVPEPVAFKVKGAEGPKEETRPPSLPEAPRRNPARVNGEVNLQIAGQLIVEGKNLYSTWEGGFKISLREKGIYLLGKLTPRRGTVNFFGRSFRLSRGNVHFNDVLGVAPILDLEADYFREDLDALLKITGRTDNPRFRLQSNPPLPEDEILSHILFGKDMSSITGLQAFEVGMALRSMMDSEGSDWDFMGKARELLKVDQLEFRESGDAQGSAEIVAGRQINNRLYLEFNQSLKEPGTSIMLEYEIRRNLSITTETGTHILPGIGVNWKRDY